MIQMSGATTINVPTPCRVQQGILPVEQTQSQPNVVLMENGVHLQAPAKVDITRLCVFTVC